MTKDFNLIKWIRWINIFKKQLSVINSIFNLHLNRGFSIATSNSQNSCLWCFQHLCCSDGYTLPGNPKFVPPFPGRNGKYLSKTEQCIFKYNLFKNYFEDFMHYNKTLESQWIISQSHYCQFLAYFLPFLPVSSF